ncbi:hypothetical protein [Thermoanaerobacterium sp. RBIITD]|uniref:hypothetical protein n=1 Tax=Thermoanaerobacterium sp. RBIITD TaxID=1550240 RepID=UPI000BB7310F|nr:hypothetical protein [Thermoanaerobacterium sp. RBIITD]SNX54241.1 hypothetical protein SAMN05660242_1891 [Thermoanaerobacterium sp. RBIITD]
MLIKPKEIRLTDNMKEDNRDDYLVKRIKNIIKFAVIIILLIGLIPMNIFTDQGVKVYIDGQLINFT